MSKPSALKHGRNPRYPYVPVVVYDDGRQSQVRGYAFVTRDEAVAFAKRYLDNVEANYAAQMAAYAARHNKE
jgi:hypothetical protein